MDKFIINPACSECGVSMDRGSPPFTLIFQTSFTYGHKGQYKRVVAVVRCPNCPTDDIEDEQ